jgi:p-cumate 2,3-dioxygenase beta subunit
MMKNVSIREIESFLIEEAALLDEWRLNEWLELMDEDAHYLIPPLDKPESDWRAALFIASDDMKTLKNRVDQLMGKMVWAENPKSRTRRLITNVRILCQNDPEDGIIKITANFAIWRFQMGNTDIFVGKYMHKLRLCENGDFKFKERKSVLDLESLRPQGKISFIL